MDIFEQAKARADEIAPQPSDRPVAAGLTTFGFGLLVVGVFIALRWFGVSDLLAWLGAAIFYGGIGYADSELAWRRNRREFHEALADLKAQPVDRSLH